MKESRTGSVKDLRSKHYCDWRNEVVLDFGDYTFTRNELNDIDMGLHIKAARNLHRISRRYKFTLANLRDMGLPSIRRMDGMGETTCLVLAYCLVACMDPFDIHKWMDKKVRTIRGGVLSFRKKTA